MRLLAVRGRDPGAAIGCATPGGGPADRMSVPAFHRLAFDACSRYLFDPSIRRGVLLAGARRVGKTTVLYQLAERLLAQGAEPTSILYLSLDHPVLKLLTIEKILAEYHDQVRPAGEPAVLLLDEVQYSHEWDLHLKVLIDHRPELRIVATGSAALRQRRDAIDSGVGRWITVPMPTLSFYEFLQMRGRALPNVPSEPPAPGPVRPGEALSDGFGRELPRSAAGVSALLARRRFSRDGAERRDRLLPAHSPGGRGRAGAEARHGRPVRSAEDQRAGEAVHLSLPEHGRSVLHQDLRLGAGDDRGDGDRLIWSCWRTLISSTGSPPRRSAARRRCGSRTSTTWPMPP